MVREPFTHILVGVDFSESSFQALEEAVRLAGRDGARVTVAHMVNVTYEEGHWPADFWTQTWSVPPPVLSAKLTALLRKELEEKLRAFEGLPLQIDLVVELARPVERLLELMRERGCDLLLVSATGKNTWERLLLGSTTEQLVRKSSVPVWVFRPRVTPRLQRVVAATDFSPIAARVVREASRQVQAEAVQGSLAHLDVVNVYWDPGQDRWASVAVPEEQERYRDETLRRTREQFRAFVCEHVPTEIQDVSIRERLMAGKPAPTLLRYVQENKTDLLVVGRHTYGRLRQVFLSSTTERLLRHAPCSVLVVEPQSADEENSV